MIYISEHFANKKVIQENLIAYIIAYDNEEEKYENLIRIISDQKIRSNKYELKTFLHMLAKISNHHHRNPFFFEKIEKILTLLKTEMKAYYSNWEIFNIFKANKRVLLFLFEKKILVFDENLFDFMTIKKYSKSNYIEYFAPELKQFMEKESERKKYENNLYYKEIISLPIEDMELFNKNRKKGENESLICKYIQSDSIGEFITFINKKDYSINDIIDDSIFETNVFLLNETVSLIQYAAFFGSTQIFKYLFQNKAKCKSNLWYFAIHGDDPEIISIIEENNIIKNQDIIEYYLNDFIQESLKCHHYSITNYFIENYSKNKLDDPEIISFCFQYYNFLYLPKEMYTYDVLFNACKFDYYSIVESLIKTQNVDLNKINPLNDILNK